MTTFLDFSRSLSLPDPTGDSSAARTGALDAGFPALLVQHGLQLWSPGSPIPEEGTWLLIGVATWSLSDMKLLDRVSQANGWAGRVGVFNVAGCSAPSAFEQYIPGIGPVFHTPVVGLWSDGKLKEKASGKAGRDLVGRVCGPDPLETEHPSS
jgi:hypothetical protein